MLFKFAASALTILVSLHAAQAYSCSSGPLQCCQSVETANSPAVASLLGLLGVVVQDINTSVGVTCSPVTASSAGDTDCAASLVCCEDNSFNGLVAIGCAAPTESS